MKVLYIGRVFSGLESSLLSGKWSPTGVPTIYKMIEALDRSEQDVRFVLCERSARDGFWSQWPHGERADLALEGLANPVTVLAQKKPANSLAGRLRDKLALIAQLFQVASEIRSFDPDLVYVDRSNVLSAALAARWFRKPVILRVMGIYPSMWEIVKGRSLVTRLERWAFRSPFAFALCTQDGTGGETWMKAALAPRVSRAAILNGVELAPDTGQPLPQQLKDLPKDRLIVMFIGRLEDIKGWREFVEGVLRVSSATRERIHAVMIGTGADKQERDELVRQSGADDMFTLIDRVAHSQIHATHKAADIYVSLNKLGNLSNANLECFRDGMCIIMPASDIERGVDVETDRLIPADAAVRLQRDRLAEELALALDRLVSDPGEIARLERTMKAAAQKCLMSWHARIDAEIELVEKLASGRDASDWVLATA